MTNLLVQLIIAFVGSIPAVFLALWVERQRLPNLVILATEEANADNTYDHQSPKRWKFFRLVVKNQPFSGIWSWVPRQAAENCRAIIEFNKIGTEDFTFTMNGRWASTPEIPYDPQNALLRIIYPDPVTIPVRELEYLDIVVKNETDNEAYGWNNEAYINDWKTPNYRLTRGKYDVKATLTTQNGKTFVKKFNLQVSDKIEDTRLTNIKN